MSTTTWSIRPATYADVDLLSHLVMDAIKAQSRWPEMSADEEAEWLAGMADRSRACVDDGNLHCIHLEDGEVIGRLRVRRFVDDIDGHEVWRVVLLWLQLRPAWQGRGIGTTLITQLQDEAAGLGGVVDIPVEHDNPDARRLYERLGFVVIGGDDKELEMRWSAVPRTVTG